MQEYWPQHKVFLFGQLAFLPDDLENKALTQKKLRHYFAAESAEELETALNEYQRQDYFTVKVIASPSESRQYIIANANHAKLHDELMAYLKEIKAKLPTEQRDLLWAIAAKQYREHGYRPAIRWRDIYGDTTKYNYTPPFWELIFMPVTLGQTKLVKIAYDKVVPFLQGDDGLKEMPEEMLQFYTRPRAEFEVLDKVLRQRISRPHRTVKCKVAIILTKGRKLQLSLGEKRLHTVKEYKSDDGNAYRTAFALYSSRSPLKKDELGVKPNTKSTLNDLVSNAGFVGVLRDVFIEINYSKGTVTLKRSVDVDEEQYEHLLDYVNDKSKKSE